MLGGGRTYFLPNTTADPENSTVFGSRTDGKNLIQVKKARFCILNFCDANTLQEEL